MNPSERINQVILSNLYNDQPFKAIPRVDRCTTCHLGIDQKTYQDAPQPFKTHPNLDLYLSSASPHPMENFRLHDLPRRARSRDELPECGAYAAQRRTAQGVAEEIRLARRGVHLETPMLPMNNIEAGCYKCHNASPEVPKAAALNSGRDLIRIYGCFGCHKIPGYENIRKVGPDLSTVSGKLTKDWVRKWLANPKEFKSQARMPQFWWNSNNSGHRASPLLGQAECRGNQCDYGISLVEFQTERTAGWTDQRQCGDGQTDRRNGRMLRLPCDRADSGSRKSKPDPPPAWIQSGKPGQQGHAVLDLQLGKRSHTGLAGNEDAESATDAMKKLRTSRPICRR